MDSSPLTVITWSLAIVVVAGALPAAIGSQMPVEDRAGSGAAGAGAQDLVPSIRFAAPVFDFGKIAAGTVVHHDYVFSNPGNAPLVVTGVYPSCDCTAAGKWSVRVEAGQTGVVPVQFDSHGYRGGIDKLIMVTSNASDRPKVVLMLKGRVGEPIDVSPTNAVFARPADTTESETKVIHITNHTDEPLILAAPESTNPAFAVELRTIREGKEFELRVTAVAAPGAGAAHGLITVKTSYPQVPVIAVTALTVMPKSNRNREGRTIAPTRAATGAAGATSLSPRR